MHDIIVTILSSLNCPIRIEHAEGTSQNTFDLELWPQDLIFLSVFLFLPLESLCEFTSKSNRYFQRNNHDDVYGSIQPWLLAIWSRILYCHHIQGGLIYSFMQFAQFFLCYAYGEMLLRQRASLYCTSSTESPGVYVMGIYLTYERCHYWIIIHMKIGLWDLKNRH